MSSYSIANEAFRLTCEHMQCLKPSLQPGTISWLINICQSGIPPITHTGREVWETYITFEAKLRDDLANSS